MKKEEEKNRTFIPLSMATENREERQYLDLCLRCLGAPLRPNRTGTDAYTTFGAMMRFDLSNGHIPLLTTKKMPWKTIILELLWFISGNTSSKTLSAQGCKIWDANGTKEFLESRGLVHRQEGDLGPVYGFQWRHWGAAYTNCNDNYEGEGVDQIAKLIETIKKDPSSRRLILSAWNVEDLDKMALPPCHMMCQFDVFDGEISCLLYQRSADMGLGVPFNMASYAILTRMIAQVCGLRAKELVHVMGNTHVYKDHEAPLKEQMARLARPFPVLKIDESVMGIDDFKLEHFQLVDYTPYSAIKMKMHA